MIRDKKALFVHKDIFLSEVRPFPMLVAELHGIHEVAARWKGFKAVNFFSTCWVPDSTLTLIFILDREFTAS